MINAVQDVQEHFRTVAGSAAELLPAVASRLRTVLNRLDSTAGGFVGRLPSNVRLGEEHKPHLSQLLEWVGAAQAAIGAAQAASASAAVTTAV